MNSFSDQAQLTCPQCQHSFTTEVWLIIDMAERPDLSAKARAESLHQVPCPNCGGMGTVDAPLLVYRPGGQPPVFFSPAQRTNEEQDREQAEMLVGIARERLGEAWQDEWLSDGLPGVPRHLVPAALSDDPAAALREMDAQAKAELERMRQENPEEFERFQGEAEQMLASDPAVEAMWQFLDAESWADAKGVVEQHPELLTDQTDQMLVGLAEAARSQKDESARGVFEEHRTVLQRCREVGIAEAFAGMIEGAQE